MEPVTDDDGSFRQDIRYCEGDFDLRPCLLEENILEAGQKVGLTGFWSASKRGVVSNASIEGVQVFRGTPREAVRTARMDGVKKISQGLLSFGLFYLLVGVGWWPARVDLPLAGDAPSRPGEEAWKQTVAAAPSPDLPTAPPFSPSPWPAHPTAPPFPPSPWPALTPAMPLLSTPAPAVTHWTTEINVHGGYSLEYPSEWSILRNYGPTSALERHRFFIGDEANQGQWVGLELSIQKTGAGCPDPGFEASFGENYQELNRLVCGTAVPAFQTSFQEVPGRTVVTQTVRFASGPFCYLIFTKDLEGMPHQSILDHMLETFACE